MLHTEYPLAVFRSKAFLVATILVILAGFWVYCRLTSAAQPTAGPHLEIVGGRMDLGVIAPNTKVAGSIHIRNSGTQDLLINELAPDCGCTNAHIDNVAIKPGESTTMHITFNSTGYFRQVHKAIAISSNDQHSNPVVLGVDAYVRVGHRLDAMDVSLGSAHHGEKVVGSVNLLRDPKPEEEVVFIEGDCAGLAVSQSKWIHQGEVDIKTIKFSSDALISPPGSYSRLCQVLVNDGTRLPLSVDFVVLPSVVAEPSLVSFKTGKAPLYPVSVKLHSSGSNVDFERVDVMYKKCMATLSNITPRGATLDIEHSSHDSPNNDFDVIAVYYRAGSGTEEKITIPITFSP